MGVRHPCVDELHPCAAFQNSLTEFGENHALLSRLNPLLTISCCASAELKEKKKTDFRCGRFHCERERIMKQ